MKKYRAFLLTLLLLGGVLFFNNAQEDDTGLSEDTGGGSLEVYVDEGEAQLLHRLATGGSSVLRAEWEQLLLMAGEITPQQAEDYLKQEDQAYERFIGFVTDYFFEDLGTADLTAL